MNAIQNPDDSAEPSEELNALAGRVIGAAIEVHSVLGPGYQEAICEEALAIELGQHDIPFERQKDFAVPYKRHSVGEGRIDFLIEGVLVVEIKAVERLLPVHKAQVISYLKATGSQLGLLINFNENLLKNGIQRIVYSRS